jgi:hypothetical protein
MGLAGGQHEKRLEIYLLETIPFTFFSKELMAHLSFLLEAPHAVAEQSPLWLCQNLYEAISRYRSYPINFCISHQELPTGRI